MCLLDSPRTLAFKKAIEAAVKPGDIVVDIGSGTGIMALFAAQAGAAKVYAVEVDHDLCKSLRLTFSQNGFDSVIEVIEGNAADVALPKSVDVLIGELIETGLIDEMQVPVVNELVGSGVIGANTRVIPSRYETMIEPIYSNNEYYGFKIFAPKHQWPFYSKTDNGWHPVDITSLDEPQRLFDLPLNQVNDRVVNRTVEFNISSEKPVTGVRLSGKLWLNETDYLGGTNALNGDKIYSFAPITHTGKLAVEISYTMGAGMKSFSLKPSIV